MLSSSKRRIHTTSVDLVVTHLRGEVGEAITSWTMWRSFRPQEQRLITRDIRADLENVQLRKVSILVERLRDDLVARLFELGDDHIGRANFHFLAAKLPQFKPAAESYGKAVLDRGMHAKRNRDISHKEVPERWEDHRHRYVDDRALTYVTVRAIRLMKSIDRVVLGAAAPYLWQIARRKRYEPLFPASGHYMILPHIRLPDHIMDRVYQLDRT
jgi:hypothetical protein